MAEEKPKKKRSPNFSNYEVDLLCELVVKYSSVVECKKSDAMAWQEKLEGWKKLTSEFNNKNNGLPRTITTLRGKYETFKKHLRKKAAKHRQALYKTGGGVIEEPSLTPSEEKIYDIISLSTDGLSARFDDDIVNEAKRDSHVEANIMGNESDDYDGEDIIALDAEEKENREPNTNTAELEPLEEIIFIEVNDDALPIDSSSKVEANEKNLLGSKAKQSISGKNLKSFKSPPSKSLEKNRNKNLLTKLQASQKVNILAESKKELVNLQIQYLKKVMEYEEKHYLIKIKKAEEELKNAELDVEIKEIDRKIKQETLKKILEKNSGCDFLPTWK